jgi:hypothetical protein
MRQAQAELHLSVVACVAVFSREDVILGLNRTADPTGRDQFNLRAIKPFIVARSR